MYYFCTYFDHRYLARGLALHQSLRRHCSPFQLWVLCMDRACYDVLSKLKLLDVHLIALEDFERGDEELLKAKQNRTQIEYYFTCTPSILLFILKNYAEVKLITYLDSDLFFFANPAPVYAEIDNHSIAIVEHRFPEYLRDREKYGIYNVGWLSFRRDEHALTCLGWWRNRCIEWCYDRVEDGRFADQKYLDQWPVLFPGVVALSHKGVNLAPWNLMNYEIHVNRGSVGVDGQPLIFFHFQNLKQIENWAYDAGLADYKIKLSPVVRRYIYGPYIQTLFRVTRQISPLLPEASMNSSIRGRKTEAHSSGRLNLAHTAARRLRRLGHNLKAAVSGKYILAVNGRVI